MEAVVMSANDITSPCSGRRVAALLIWPGELPPGIPVHPDFPDPFCALGAITLMNDLVLSDTRGGAEILVPRHSARLSFTPPRGSSMLVGAPPELVPFLQRVRAGWAFACKEAFVVTGDRLRLTAHVMPATPGSPILVARADLGPVQLGRS